MEVVRYTIQAAIAFFEIWLCYQVLYFIVLEKHYMTKKEKGIILNNTIVLGIMLAINRDILFFSHYMFLMCIIVTIFSSWLIKKKDFWMIAGVVTLYYSSVSLVDFFFAFGSMIFLKDSFYQIVYIDDASWWQELIFICSRMSIAGGVYLLQKKKEIRESFKESRNLILVVSVIFCIVLRKYQYKLCDIANGRLAMEGLDAGVSLVVTITIIAFAFLMRLNYRKVQDEKRFLLQIDGMSEQYYKEAAELLEKNHQLIHDVKNHFIIIKNYAETGKNIELCEYIEEISPNLLKDRIHAWSGNKILDLILDQKRCIAEYNKIDFYIMTDKFKHLSFKDNEICSLFGNLLDNAIEACEQVHTGKKWIEVKVNLKNQLLFIEVSNSIEKKPFMKNGKLVTSKGNNNMHGYGNKSIEWIVQKYDGTISYQIEESRFQVCITFFDMEVPL